MKTSFNTSVNLSLSNQANSSDASALLVREVLENSQVMNFLADHLTDSRNPDRVVYSLTSQMRTVILQRALGWSALPNSCWICTAKEARPKPIWAS